MANWKDQVYGFGGNKDTLSDGSATVQLSLVDANQKSIPVANSREDFIMKIPIDGDQIPAPVNISEWSNGVKSIIYTATHKEQFCYSDQK